MGAQPSRERSIPGGNANGTGNEEMIRNDSAPPRLSVEAAYELGSVRTAARRKCDAL